MQFCPAGLELVGYYGDGIGVETLDSTILDNGEQNVLIRVCGKLFQDDVRHFSLCLRELGRIEIALSLT